MVDGAVARQSLEVLRAMHDCDHDCTDGWWIKPTGAPMGAEDDLVETGWADIAPEWPCPTLRVMQAALGD